MAPLRTIALVLVTLTFASACYPLPRLQANWPTTDAIASYRVGETQSARKGEVMIDRTEAALLLPGFVMTRQIGVVGTDRQPSMETGAWVARFRYAGPCPDGTYVITNPGFYEERIGIIVAEDGTIACDMPVVQLIGGKTGRTWQLDEQLPVEGVFRPSAFIAGFEPGTIRWQLAYRGRNGRSAVLDYLEFRDNMDPYARPTFQQTITQNVGSTISLRGTEVQIASATDRDVSFRVLREAEPRRDDYAPRDDGYGYGAPPPGSGDGYYGPDTQPPARGDYGPY